MRRTLASVLAISLSVWFATPARATVECRPVPVACPHCRAHAHAQVPRGLALRPDCCIIHAAQVKPQASNPSSNVPLLVPVESPQPLATPDFDGLARTASSAALGPAPPLLHLKPPLLR